MQGSDSWQETAEDVIVTGTRHDLFRYLTSPLAEEYRAIMGLFAGPLLADLSPAEAATQLIEAGVTLTEEQVYARCERLEKWGNLVRGVRDTHAATVRDFHKGRSRFHASKLGGRIHRDTEEIMAASDGAREVARELLGKTVDQLAHILDRLRAGDGGVLTDAHIETLAADVTTVFNNQRLFNESVRDFYAYLNQILTRYDLAGEEYGQFKTMLLTYVDLITADVTRHAPAVVDHLTAIRARLDVLLAALATRTGPLTHDGTDTETLPGRTRDEWEQLIAWYTGSHSRSGPDTLRLAADQALGQLLTNAKRMLASAGTGLSRRADLIKLAGWFDSCDTDTAHRLFAAAFGTYPARHLLIGPAEPDPRDGAATSWWNASAVDVPISLRDRGDRAARGRTSPVPDPGEDRETILAAAEAELDDRRAAAAELVAAATLHDAHVSPAARDLVLDRLGHLIAIHQDLTATVSVTDADLALVITAEPAPDAITVLHSHDGTVTIHDLHLTAASSQTPSSDAPPTLRSSEERTA
jgi:uncharacterized protein (TIGR02677 family)